MNPTTYGYSNSNWSLLNLQLDCSLNNDFTFRRNKLTRKKEGKKLVNYISKES